ncbi:MAG: hypothetical protein RLZZ221_513 [Verrucomicrobiota bacterium]|jgi:hypothetical protein
MTWGAWDYLQAIVNPIGSTVDIASDTYSAYADARQRQMELDERAHELAAKNRERKQDKKTGSSTDKRTGSGTDKKTGSSTDYAPDDYAPSGYAPSMPETTATVETGASPWLIAGGLVAVVAAIAYVGTRK